MNYYDKYLKYKNKYLNLKFNFDNLEGGDIAFIKNYNSINLFTNSHKNLKENIEIFMEEYLNPIYGFILLYNGYIYNNYYLFENIKNDDSKLIKKILKEIPSRLLPTNILMKIEPIKFGNYLALKYINYYYYLVNNNEYQMEIKLIKDKKLFNFNNYKFTSYENDFFIKIIELFNDYVQITNNNLFSFHILLYCLIWVSNNDNGIKEYYKGINQVFCIFNKYTYSIDKEKFKYIDLNIKNNDTSTNTFEHYILTIFNKDFIIYNQEWAKHFCIEKETYPDCGEVTARNLINLICFNGTNFNIEILQNLGAIDELILFYTKFNNFKNNQI